MLHRISTFHRMIDFEIKLYVCEPQGSQVAQEVMRCYLESVLQKSSSLERVQICLCHHGRPFESELFRQFPPDIGASCESKKLRFVSVYHECYFPTTIKTLDRSKRWDIALFPSLMMNWYDNLSRSSFEEVLPLAIKAISTGNAYQTVTNHTPTDVTLANASLIFCVVKD
jgi:hypothetical protein